MKKNIFTNAFAVLVPVVLGFLAYRWFFAEYGPAQALAYKSVNCIIALCIVFTFMRLMNIVNGLDFKTWHEERHPRDQANIYITRFIVCGIIVSSIFLKS